MGRIEDSYCKVKEENIFAVRLTVVAGLVLAQRNNGNVVGRLSEDEDRRQSEDYGQADAQDRCNEACNSEVGCEAGGKSGLTC